MTTTTPDRTRDQAAAFLDDIAGRREPWEELLLPWASERGLTVLELRELRRAVLRRRIFGTHERRDP